MPTQREIAAAAAAARYEAEGFGAPEGFDYGVSSPPAWTMRNRSQPFAQPFAVQPRAQRLTLAPPASSPPAPISPPATYSLDLVEAMRESEIASFELELAADEWEREQEREQEREFGTISDTERAAARNHACTHCGETIMLRDLHRVHVYRFDGGLKTDRICLACQFEPRRQSNNYTGPIDFDPWNQEGR